MALLVGERVSPLKGGLGKLCLPKQGGPFGCPPRAMARCMDPIKSTLQTTEGCHATPINWERAARVVQNLRGRIFRATRQGDDTATRHLQRLLLSSRSCRLLAAREEMDPCYHFSYHAILRDGMPPNKGETPIQRSDPPRKVFPASGEPLPPFPPQEGLSLSLERRLLALVNAVEGTTLARWGYQDQPSSLTSRCMQSIVRHALEPEWEARGERGVYGPRPGRSCHDALATLSSLACSLQSEWVVTGNLSPLLLGKGEVVRKIAPFPRADVVKRWLEWRSMVENPFRGERVGGGRDRVIQPLSPLLGTIFLHGLEGALACPQAVSADSRVSGKSGGGVDHPSPPEWGLHGKQTHAYIRDKERFVVLCPSRGEALRLARVARGWVGGRVASLPAERIRVERLVDGIDFLHVHIRCFPPPPQQRGKGEAHFAGYAHPPKQGRGGGPFGEGLGVARGGSFQLRLSPSREAVSRLRDRLLGVWNRSRGKGVVYPIRQLNPYVLRWSSYFRHYDSADSFRSLDNWMLQRAVRYAKRAHPKKGWCWIKERYFLSTHPSQPSQGWVLRHGGESLRKFQWMGLSSYCPIPPPYSVDDPTPPPLQPKKGCFFPFPLPPKTNPTG